MEHLTEERFVRSFIRKRYQKRLLYELTTPGKRYKGLTRFCHQSDELLEPSKILAKDRDAYSSTQLGDLVGEQGGTCLILSPDPAADGQLLPLKEAAEYAARSLDAVIILGDGYALVFGEPMRGGREIYLLSE